MTETIKEEASLEVQLPPAKPKIAVQIDGVRKQFGDATALHEVSLKVYQGEFLTLLGPSGCGKTTLLNLMAGFVEADNGEIFIDGLLVTDTPPYQRDIGIVFQNYALFPHMNVADNIGYGLRMRRIPKEEIQERVKQILKLVKLEAFSQRRPRELESCCSVSRASFPEGSSSVLLWRVHWSSAPKSFFWTSPSRLSTRIYASTCSKSSRKFSASSA